ncbi:MAG: hypothetical protein J0L56_00090 [Chitinophagales bacterium]|nr:hypothetical protein [Chitinophagales bacterium]
MPLTKQFAGRILFLLLLAAGIFFITLIPQTYEREVTVPYTMLKTGEQLSLPVNLVKWYLPFAIDDSVKKNISGKKEIKTSDYSLLTTETTSISTLLIAGWKNKQKQFHFTASADSGEMSSSKIKLTYKSTLLNKWLDKGQLIKNAEESLLNLKAYMEDTRQFYGYQIEQTTVTDTSFIFLSAIVPVTEKRAATRKLFEQLINYSKQKDGGYTGTRIFYTVPYGKDQVMLFASIGISGRIIIKKGEQIQYKRMPWGKNLLVASYQGPYKDISKVYTALENFKADHSLSSMAIPYQKFFSDGYDFDDDQVVQMKVYYPIF